MPTWNNYQHVATSLITEKDLLKYNWGPWLVQKDKTIFIATNCLPLQSPVKTYLKTIRSCRNIDGSNVDQLSELSVVMVPEQRQHRYHSVRMN